MSQNIRRCGINTKTPAYIVKICGGVSMDFVVRFLLLAAVTAVMMIISDDKWRKHNKLLMVTYFIITAVIFLA